MTARPYRLVVNSGEVDVPDRHFATYGAALKAAGELETRWRQHARIINDQPPIVPAEKQDENG